MIGPNTVIFSLFWHAMIRPNLSTRPSGDKSKIDMTIPKRYDKSLAQRAIVYIHARRPRCTCVCVWVGVCLGGRMLDVCVSSFLCIVTQWSADAHTHTRARAHFHTHPYTDTHTHYIHVTMSSYGSCQADTKSTQPILWILGENKLVHHKSFSISKCLFVFGQLAKYT